MTMSEITNPKDVLKIYDRIFTEHDGYYITFMPAIKKRGILSPTAPTLDKKYTKAFLKAALSTGDEAFYVSLTERIASKVCDWQVSLDLNSVIEFIERQEYYYSLEHAVFSINGKWGIWFTSDFYAIVGGSEEFIAILYNELGITIDEMVLNFMKGIQSKKVIPKRLESLFGAEEVERYLKMYK